MVGGDVKFASRCSAARAHPRRRHPYPSPAIRPRGLGRQHEEDALHDQRRRHIPRLRFPPQLKRQARHQVPAQRHPLGIPRAAEPPLRPVAPSWTMKQRAAAPADLVPVINAGRVEDDRPGRAGTRPSLCVLGERPAQDKEEVRQFVRMPRQSRARRILRLDELKVARLSHDFGVAVKAPSPECSAMALQINPMLPGRSPAAAHACGTRLWHTPAGLAE